MIKYYYSDVIDDALLLIKDGLFKWSDDRPDAKFVRIIDYPSLSKVIEAPVVLLFELLDGK